MEDQIDVGNLGKGFHIAHLNARSLMNPNSHDMLKEQIARSGINIFSISETWLTAAIPSKLIDLPSMTFIDWTGLGQRMGRD